MFYGEILMCILNAHVFSVSPMLRRLPLRILRVYYVFRVSFNAFGRKPAESAVPAQIRANPMLRRLPLRILRVYYVFRVSFNAFGRKPAESAVPAQIRANPMLRRLPFRISQVYFICEP
jgi:hypothetical protein